MLKTIKGIRLPFLAVLLLLGIGIFARCYELSWHFPNVDDMGIAEHILRNQHTGDIFTIPKWNTNAPFQFIFTHFLLTPDQTYRDVLFWSRLPSCVAGVLGLVMLALFYWKLDRFQSFRVYLALILFGFSWENIAHAKQANDYAAGTAAVVVLCFLFLAASRTRLTWFKILLLAPVLALINSIQYVTFIFVPAFYLALFLSARNAELRPSLKILVRNFALSGALYTLCVFPLWHFFLRHKIGSSTPHHAAGLNQEYLFSWDHFNGLGERVWDLIQFFPRNFYLVFQTRLGFAPETSGTYFLLSLLFFGLFAAGIISLIRTKDPAIKHLRNFLGLSLLVWLILIFAGKLTLGPTRHTLFMLPVFAIITAEGLSFLAGHAASLRRSLLSRAAGTFFPWALVTFCTVVFLTYYPVFLKERRDPVDESKIVRVLRAHNVTQVIIDKRSTGGKFMKELLTFIEELDRAYQDPYVTIARLTRYPIEFSMPICERERAIYNAHLKMQGAPFLAVHPCTDYHLIYSWEFDSGGQVEFSDKVPADILKNRFYLYIAQLKDLPAKA